jgi:outer membrane protein
VKKILLSTALLASFATADFLGVEAGITAFSNNIDGNFKYKGDLINTKDTIGIDETNSNIGIWVSFEHPAPLIPNVKIKHVDLEYSGNKSLTNNTTFANKSFNANETIQSNIELTQTDFIAYYEILDNYVNLDLGLNLKLIDTKFKIASTNQVAQNDISTAIPMLYTKAKVELPFSGAFLEAELSYIGYSGNTIYDAQASVGYESSLGLGANLGYRKINLKLDDVKDTSTNITVDGAFASVFYHF